MHKPRIVVDTSVIIKWLNTDKEEYLNEANKLLDEALDAKIELLAPDISKYEVGNVLLFSKKLTPQQGASVLEQFYTYPIQFIPESEELAKETYNLAFDLKITYYDASFMSLAKQENATLVTDNIKHQGKDSTIKVVQLRDY